MKSSSVSEETKDMKKINPHDSLIKYLMYGYKLWKKQQNRYSWLWCPICSHDLNGDGDSFKGESKDHMFWNYKCANCGCNSKFGLWFPMPIIYSHQKFNKKMEIYEQR